MRILIFVVVFVAHMSVGLSAEKQSPLQKMMKRELSALKSHTLSTSEGGFSFKTEAKKAPKIEKVDGAWYVTIDIGTQSPMECYIYQDYINPISSIESMAKYVMGDKALQQDVSLLNAGMYGKNPYVRMDTSFIVLQNKQKALAVLKAAVTSRIDKALVCLHYEIGYSKTFARIFAGISKSLVFTEKSEKPLFREVRLISVAGKNAGFSEIAVYKEGKSRKTVSLTSLGLYLPSRKVITMDDLIVEYSEIDGSLKEALYSGTQAGQLVRDLSVKTADGKTFLVDGKLQGKAIKKSFSVKEKMMGSIQHNEVLAKTFFGSKKSKSITLYSYTPHVNPIGQTKYSYQLKSKTTKKAEISFELGAVLGEGTIDKDGSSETLNMKIGSMEMKYLRVLKAGQL